MIFLNWIQIFKKSVFQKIDLPFENTNLEVTLGEPDTDNIYSYIILMGNNHSELNILNDGK